MASILGLAGAAQAPVRKRRRDLVGSPSAALVYGLYSLIILLYPIYTIAVAGQEMIAIHGASDYDLYMNATRRWLAGGLLYPTDQLAGQFDIAHGAILYPPTTLYLFVPFTVLPAVLWWILPIGVTVAAVLRHRPAPMGWPFLALCIAWPTTLSRIASGNPVIWAVAALAVGSLYAWPSVLMILKPSLGPFALFGVRRRSWWVSLFALLVLSIPLAGLWRDWVETLLNSNAGPGYSLQEVPMMMLPLVAYWFRRSGRITVAAT